MPSSTPMVFISKSSSSRRPRASAICSALNPWLPPVTAWTGRTSHSAQEINDSIDSAIAAAKELGSKDLDLNEKLKEVVDMKPEEPSSGIMKDGMGRLKHVAKPTSPEDQFIFEMIRLAIVRHYWITSYMGK